MPRKRPGAVRATQSCLRVRREVSAVRGVSSRTQAAIALAEARHLGPGWVAQAIERYRRFLNQPGRWLYIPSPDCPCCDPVDARDELEDALRVLPRHARAELRKMIDPLDEEFRRRTLPDLQARSISLWHAHAWWRQRLHEEQ